jgi:hypothetical protein
MLKDKHDQCETEQSGAAPPNANVIKVRVEKRSENGKEYECDILPDDHQSGPYVSNNVITLPNKGGPFRIKYRLVNLDWNTADPFWSKKSGCPNGKGNDEEQIFLQPPNGREMAILDLNEGDKCQIHYRMNFQGGYFCDPIVDNGGNN